MTELLSKNVETVIIYKYNSYVQEGERRYKYYKGRKTNDIANTWTEHVETRYIIYKIKFTLDRLKTGLDPAKKKK